MKLVELLKNNNLDLIRILLATAVIVGHSFALNGSGGYWIDPIRYFFPLTNFGPLAVKIFLFISGLVVTNSYLIRKSASYFIFSRIFRILPGLLFLLLITVFIFGPLLTHDTNYWLNLNYFEYVRHNIVFYTNHRLPGVFVNNLYPNIVNGSLWTLRFEVGCYIILLLFFILLGNKNKYLLVIPILIIFVDFMIPNRYIFGFIDNDSDKLLVPLFFSYGSFFAIFAEKIKINWQLLLLSFILFITSKDSRFEEVLLAILLCHTVLYISVQKWFLRFKPKYDVSYGIYLWGFLIQQTVYYIFGHLYIGLHCIIAIFVSVIFAIFTFVLVEKPFMQIGKKLHTKYKNKQQIII